MGALHATVEGETLCLSYTILYPAEMSKVLPIALSREKFVAVRPGVWVFFLEQLWSTAGWEFWGSTTPPINGVGTNFGVGVGEARPEGPRAGDGVLGEGTASHSHQLGGLRERCKLPQRGPGCSGPSPEWFSCILSRQIPFPRISVRVAYSLHS